MSEELRDKIYSMTTRSLRILYITIDLLDPRNQSIRKHKLQEIKAQAEEIQKEAQSL